MMRVDGSKGSNTSGHPSIHQRRAARAIAVTAGVAVAVALSASAWAAGALENPQPGGRESGIGIVSGWHCDARRVDIEIDGTAAYQAAYGTARADTQPACGKSNTGFAVLINWNTLGAGPHVIRALADGVEFARATANVVTLGAEFQSGRKGTMRLDNFPDAGKGVVVEWQESKQNFAIRELLTTVPAIAGNWYGPVLEQWHGCNDAQYNGNHGANATWTVALYDSVNLVVNGNIQTTPAFSCSYTGTHSMDGPTHSASGTFTCTNGKQGSWRTSEFVVTDRALTMTGDGNWTQGSQSCQMRFLIGGYRHLPLP